MLVMLPKNHANLCTVDKDFQDVNLLTQVAKSIGKVALLGTTS